MFGNLLFKNKVSKTKVRNMTRNWNKPKFKWRCPQCGSERKTYDDVPPLCKGNKHPDDPYFHIFTYIMEEVKGESK